MGVGVCGWVGAGVSEFSSPMNPKKKKIKKNSWGEGLELVIF